MIWIVASYRAARYIYTYSDAGIHVRIRIYLYGYGPAGRRAREKEDERAREREEEEREIEGRKSRPCNHNWRLFSHRSDDALWWCLGVYNLIGSSLSLALGGNAGCSAAPARAGHRVSERALSLSLSLCSARLAENKYRRWWTLRVIPSNNWNIPAKARGEKLAAAAAVLFLARVLRWWVSAYVCVSVKVTCVGEKERERARMRFRARDMCAVNARLFFTLLMYRLLYIEWSLPFCYT